MEPYFDHEKLRVYQEALKFVHLKNIVSMLVGLIRSNSPDRVFESSLPYNTGDYD
jgi:hypothetical protein